MKWFVCFCAAAATALAQNGGALLPNAEALKLDQRAVQLIESTGMAVPGLARAGAPALEDARQSLINLLSNPQSTPATYLLLLNLRAYLAISDTVPKPYPFPEEARRQFAELRDAADRLDTHLLALMESQELRLNNPDRDNLARYAEADQRVGPSTSPWPRVVFLGDSITDGWRLKEYYGSDRDFLNRGISGQITGEMLGRMKADVIDLKPRLMLILGGTNDLARGVAVSTIENNLSMIADLAEAHRIVPLFASILPVSDYHKGVNPQFEMTKHRPPAKIVELNNWLRTFCAQRQFPYVDYYSAMVDNHGYLQADLSDDGLHPNAKGYRIMSPIALAAIDAFGKAEAKGKKKGGIGGWLQKEHR